jgi:hypothetical protein
MCANTLYLGATFRRNKKHGGGIEVIAMAIAIALAGACRVSKHSFQNRR